MKGMTSTAIAQEDKIYTVEEYFEFEKNSEIRYEYHYGKLLLMPEESITANQIASNCNRNLWIERFNIISSFRSMNCR